MVRNMSVLKPVSTLMVPLMIETIYKRVRSMSKDLTNEEIYEKVFGGSLKRIYSGGAHLDPFYVERFGELGTFRSWKPPALPQSLPSTSLPFACS